MSMAPAAVTKTLAHVLKHHCNDCIGVLLGGGTGREVEINDVVPLFHERVMTPAVETALEMIEALYDGQSDKKIIGVYDAPIKGVSEDGQHQVSSLALSLAEQIKQANDSVDSIIIRVVVPKGSDGESEEPQVREISTAEEENLRAVLFNAFACQSTS